MTRVIGIANPKGGVGKTTSAVNLACGAARMLGDGNVLLIDIDPQANATHVLMGLEMAAGPRRVGVYTIKEVLMGEVSAESTIQEVPLAAAVSKNGSSLPASTLHVVSSHLELATIEAILTTKFRGEYQLQKAIAPVLDRYDLIIVDCPPSLGSLTLNALIFCEEIVIPVNPGEFSLVGLGLLQSTISQAREANPRLHISGVLPNAIGRTRLARETVEALHAHFEALVLPSIPERVAIGEAHSSGGDIFAYAPGSDGAVAYERVLKELLGHD